MKKLLVTLTVSESKRLIAKGLLATEEVTTALQEGYLCVTLGTTSSYLVEEILGSYDKTKHIAGLTKPEGMTITQKEHRAHDAIFHRGEYLDEKKVIDVLSELGPKDVIIKSVNAFDRDWTPIVLLASETGGTVGSFIGAAAAKNVTIVMPGGFEKFIPVSYDDFVGQFGKDEWDYTIGWPVGAIAIPEGIPFTEIDALQALFGVLTIPIAAGGINGAEGSVTFFIQGEDAGIARAHEFLEMLKGEPPFPEVKHVQ